MKTKAQVVILDNNLSIEEERRNLKNIYDVVFNIAKAQKARGIDVSSVFISKSEYENLKLEHPENFI